MNVKQLKEILKDLPDDMIVVIPNRSYEEINYSITNGCNIVMTAGILRGDEDNTVLCLNTSLDGQDIISQIKDPYIKCEKVLFCEVPKHE